MCSECCWREGVFGEPVTDSQLSLPPRRGCCRRVFTLLPWCRGGTGSFSSPLCSIETRVFVGVLFFSHGVLESPPRKAGLSQLLSRLWVFALSSTLQVFPDHSRQRLGQVAGSAAHTKVCLSVPKCTSGQDSSQVVCHLLLLDPTSSIETLLWMDA